MAVLRTLAQQNRGPGRIESPSSVIPDDATRMVRVRALTTQTVLDNAATRITLGLEVEDATQPTGWRPVTSTTFAGGAGQGWRTNPSVTVPPGFHIDRATYAGKAVRLVLDLPARIQAGGVIETVD